MNNNPLKNPSNRLCRLISSLCLGLAMFSWAVPARAQIALQDGSSATIIHTAGTGVSTNFTVTTGAKVLVFIAAAHSTAAMTFPSLSWGAQAMTLAFSTNAGNSFTACAIYYIYNPTPGAQTISGTVTGGTVDNTWFQAYTLNGVDTTVTPLIGGASSGTGGNGNPPIHNSVVGIQAASWAAVAIGNGATTATTLTVSPSGTVNVVNNTSDGGRNILMGYVSGLAAGTSSFTNNFGSANKLTLVEAIFVPVAAGAPSIGAQPTSAMVFSNGTAQFTVTAAGAAPLSYQWYRTSASVGALTAGELLTNSVALSDGVKYNGSATNTLSINNVTTGDLTNYAVIITNSLGSITSSIASLAYWPSPTLQLRMPFTDAPGGTTTASDISGGGINITMNMTTNGTIAGDLHGAPGTGVTISDPNARALDLTTNTSPTQGTNQPVSGNTAGTADIVDLLGDTTLPTLGGGNGNITSFVATIWVKMPAYAPLNAGSIGPRFWILNTGGAGVDVPTANSIGLQILSSNQVQFGYNTTVVPVNWPSGNIPLGQWLYFALTYDGANYKLYYGTDTSSVQLINTTAASGQTVALGSSASLAIGNRANNFSRSFNGWMEDFRFYNNPGDSNFVESVRASLAPLPTVPIVTTQPTPVSVYPGQNAQFTAVIAGAAPITNLWTTNGVALADGTQGDGSVISGSGTTTLTISNVTPAEALNYILTATNSSGGTNTITADGALTVLATGSATNYTLDFPGTNVVQPNGADWNTVSNWNPLGLSATVSMLANPGSTFELLSGSRLRTPGTSGLQVFPGIQLTVDGSGVFEDDNANPTNVSELRFKSGSAAPTNYFSNLVLNGGQLDQGVNALQAIEGTITVSNNSAIYIDDGATSQDRGYQIDSWLIGSGNLLWHQFDGTIGGWDLSITGTTNTFSGQWIVDQGALVGVGTGSLGTNNIIVGTNGLTAAVETLYDINNTNASLILGANGEMFLHQTDHFASVTVNGFSLTNGTYSFATLNSTYPGNFPATWTQQTNSTATSGSGEIIVGNVVVGPPSTPHITHISLSGTSLSISATNGTAGGSWTLLQTTNIALPLIQWQTNCAGSFDGGGNLSTNIVNTATNRQEFYLLKAQ
jgi:hypothetical protein